MAGKYWWDEYEQQKKEQKNNEQDNAQKSSAQGYWWDNVSSTVGNNIINRVNTYLENHNSYITDYQNRYSGRKGNYEDAYVSDSAEWYNTVKDRYNTFDADANNILSYMDQYKDYLNADWMKQVRDALAGTRDQQKSIFDIAQNDYKYWNSFGTDELVEKYGSAEEAYKYGQRSYGYSQKYDGKTYTELQDIIKNLNAQDFVGTLENSEELEWLKSYASTVDYDEKAAYDLEAAQKEIEKLEKQKATLAQKYRGILASNQSATTYLTGPNGSPQTSGNYIGKIEGEESDVIRQMKDLDDEINQKKQYLNLADRVQYGIKLSSVADPNSKNYDPEFNNYTGYVADVKYELGGKPYFDDETYAYINNPTVTDNRTGGEISARDLLGWNDTAMSKDSPYYNGLKAETIYDFMTDEEVDIYNYYYNKHGKDAAKEYIEYLSESLNARKAQKDFEKYYEGNKLLELGHSITAGLDQFGSGIANLINGVTNGDEYIPTTYSQYLSSMVREDLADVDLKWYNFKEGEWDDANIFGSSLGQTLYDVGTTTANMAPSILVSTAVDLLNPVAGAWIGATLMGASAAGNAYADAINRGLDKSQAATYGVAIGVSEALLEKALGGISKFGGTSAKITKAVSGIDDALLRWSLRFGGSFTSEALEEGLQEILDPIFQNAIFGTDEDVNWSEVAYSALLGGLSAGVFEGNSIRKDIKKEQSLKTEYEGKTDALIQEGLESDIDTESFNLAKDYQAKIESGKPLTGAEIRNLLAANQEQIAPKDLKKIQKAAEARLTELGQTKDVQKLAELATKYATGQKLSKADKAFLANNKNGNRVAQELIPENIMSGEYTSEWAEGIGTKQVNKLAYNIKNIVEQMAKPATYKPLTERVGEEEKAGVSESGKSMVNGKEISLNKKVEVVDFVRDKKTGKITDIIINADGKQVKASEIDFADADQAYLFSAVKHIENITPADAQVIIRDYDPSSGISVGEYLNGVDEAYTYGYHGYTEADMKSGLFTTRLSDEKAKGAYELGKLAKKSNKETKSEAIKRMRTAVEAETEKAVAEGKPAPKPKKMAITYNGGNGVVREFDNEAIERLPEKQRAGVKVAKVLHKLGLGTNFEFFESFESKTKKVENQKGELVPARVFINDAGVEEDAPAGVYRLSDGTIRIDLNAYNGRGLTLYALSHELTHFIQQWSTEKYEVLAEYLVSTYEKTGLTMHQRVLREQARLKGIRGKDISYNKAYDEVVANAMMKMFDDGNLVQRLTELKAKDKNLAVKLWEGFKEILNKLLGVYQSDPGVFYDTKDLMQMKEDFEVLQGMFAEALVEASENFQANLSAVEVGVEPVVENQTIQEHSGKQHSSQETDLASTEHKINTSMTMAEAKRMIETAFKVNNIAEFYEDEYADAEDWLRKAGSDEVEMYIENDFDLQARYINSNEDILNEEYRMADVLEAYLAGTLVGKEKPKPKRLDVSQSTKLEDNRFYSPQKIEDAKATYKLAIQKAVGKDANSINRARAEILLFAHNKGAAELLGITQAELNKKLRSWSNYSATARDISRKINAGVAEENRWTGIENSSYINKAKVTNEDIERLVAAVEGDSKGYERKYIARVMLAADTHIDYSKLKFKFASSQQVNADHNGGNRVLGFYDDTNRLIEVTHDKPHTVAHEMGHYIDTQWGRDLIGTDSSHLFLTRGVNEDMVRARYGEPGVQFLNNFKLFINSLSDVNQNYNSYYNDRGEIFARFFARFIEWTDNIATGSKYYSYESTMYNDKFTQAQFVEFARLLQEKALLDGKEVSKTGEQYSSQETDLDTETDSAYDGGKKKTEQEDKANGRREEVSHRVDAESSRRVGKENSGGEGSARESCERRIKEILRKKTFKGYKKSTPGRGRVELRETREAFESRSRRDGLMYVEVGSIAMACKVAPVTSWNENAKAAAEKLAQYGFDVVVFTGEMLHNRKDVTQPSVDGSTVRYAGSLTIFISADLDIDGMETAYHEAFHAARHGMFAKYHEKIANIIASNVDIESEAFDQFVSEIADLYAYTVSNVSAGKFAAEIIEEFYAWYVGKAYAAQSGEMQVDMAQFSDVESIKQQIDGVYAQMEANKKNALPGLLEGDALFSSQETDLDYMDAVNRGDTETAQKMVDEASENAGFTTSGYHGSRTPGFTVVDKYSWLWLARDKFVANEYGSHTEVDNIGKPHDKKGVYAMRYNLGNNLVVYADGNSWGELPVTEDEYPGVYADEDTGDITTNAMAEWAEKNGYDSITFVDVMDGGGFPTTVDVVFNPNRDAKSADPVTYDDDGNIIPLSQRFNSGNDDIRHSTQETDNISNRDMLANAFETLAQNSEEYKMIQKYKGRIKLLNEYEEKLSKLNAEIREIRFGKGKYDAERLAQLEAKAKEMAKLISKNDKKLLSLEASEPLRKVIEQERKKEAQKTREHIGEILQNKKLRAEAAEYRHKIKNFKKKLETKLLRPTDRQYVPVDLIGAMIDVCNLIDTDTSLYKADGSINNAQVKRDETREKLRNLKDEYEKLKNHSDPIYAGEFDDMVYTYLTELRDKFEGKSLNEMSSDELSEMYEILTSIDETLADARKLIGWGDAESVYEAGDSIVAEQNAITQKRKHGKRNAAQKGFDKIDNLGLSPVRNVERMSGYNQDSALLKLFKKFEQGIRKKNFFVMNAYKSFEELTSGKEYDNAVYKEVGGKKYTDVNGRKFGLSKMQMMQAILSYERETANKMSHISGSGFSFADLDMLRKGKLKDAISEEYSHRVPAAIEMVAEFMEILKDDKWCQDYMVAARKFFNETAKNAINETSISLKHRIIAKDKNYIPFEVDKNFVVREISAENDIQETINAYGMLKDTKKGAAQPLIITGLNNILDRHIDQVGNVYGLAIEVRNFNKVWNVKSTDGAGDNPTVKTVIQRNWGVEGVKHIEQAVQDIQGPRVRERNALYDKVKSGYIGATFLLNLSVVTKQNGSLFSATSMIKWRDPGRMLANLYWTMLNSKKISAEVDKYTATAWMRRQGMSDAELYTLMTQAKKPGLFRALDKAPAVINPIKWITARDHAVALSLWKYCKQDTAERTGLNGEELLKATAEFYNEVIENTQSMTDVLHRPEIQKKGDVISEAFGMFKTDLYQMAGQLQATAGRFMADKSKENGKALARTVYSTTMSALWGSLMTTVFALLRYKVKPYADDEEDELTFESWLKRQGAGLAGDLMGYIFPLFGSEVVGVFENIMYGESDDIVDSLALTAINDLYNAAITIGSSIKDREWPEVSDMRKLAAKALQCFVIPANNILRALDAIQLHAEDIANGEFLSFNAGLSSKTEKIYSAIVRGDMEDQDRLKSTYKDDDAYHKAVRTALRENDSRIKEAALAEINGNPSERVRIARLIIADGFVQDDVVAAINSEINALTPKEEDSGTDKKKGFYTTENLVREFANGDTTSAKAAKSDIISTAIANGKTKEQAEKDFMSNVSSSAREAYEKNWLSESKAKKLLMEYAGEDEDGATSKVNYWTLCKLYPNYKDLFTEARTKNYHEYVKPAGISMDTYAKFLTKTNGLANKYDKYGNLVQEKIDQVKDVIHSLPLTRRQKNALYLAVGYAESGLDDVPW